MKKPIMRQIKTRPKVNIHNLNQQGHGTEQARQDTAKAMGRERKKSLKRMDATLKGNKPTQKSKH